MPAAKISDEDLLARLTDLFRAFGYEGASFSRISEATGLEKSSLYHRFPHGKEEMAVAVVEAIGRHFAGHVLQPLSGEGPLVDRIRDTGDRLKRFYEDGERPCALDTLSISQGSEKLREALKSSYEAWRKAFGKAAREAGRPADGASLAAEEAIAKIHGSLVHQRVTGDRSHFLRAIDELPEILGVSEDELESAAGRGNGRRSE